jgi:hypothetical protein
MEKLCLVLAINVLWIVPSPDARVEVPPCVAPPGLQQILPAPVVAGDKAGRRVDDVYKWTTIEIIGKLHYEAGDGVRILEFEPYVGYSIMVDGKWYAADFPNKEHAAKAQELVGKRVSIKGTLGNRTLDGGLIPHTIPVVTVTQFDAAPALTEEITVRLTGQLQIDTPITYLLNAPVIIVNGQHYAIDYEGAEGVFAKARKLDGKRVVLTGKLVGTRSFPEMCRPEDVSLPVLFLTDVKAADEKAADAALFTIQGKLKWQPPVVGCVLPIVESGFHTDWVIRANGREYPVDFGDDKKMLKLASSLDGQTVLLTGALETRNIRFENVQTIERPPSEDGIWTNPLPDVHLEVLRVIELKAVEKDTAIETVHVDIQGDLESIILMGLPPIEVYTVTAGKQTFHLQFSPDLPKEKPAQLKGKKVIATGTQLDDLTILVTGLRIAGDK